MKILLMNPPPPIFYASPAGRPPLGLGYLKAHLVQHGYDVTILDLTQHIMCLNSIKLEKKLSEYRPDVIGVSCMSETYKYAKNLCTLAKKVNPNALTVMGGVHPTFCDFEVLSENPCLDLIIRGEGEYTMLEVLDAIDKTSPKAPFSRILGITYRESNNRIRRNDPRPLIRDSKALKGEELDCLQSPYLTEAFEMDEYDVAGIITARGCPCLCSFCSNSKYYGHIVRFHSVERVLSEIMHIYEHDKKTMIFIDDDTFTINEKRAHQILDGIIRLKLPIKIEIETRVDRLSRSLLELMKKAGVFRVDFGLEAGTMETLRKIKKGITLQQLRRVATWVNELGLISVVSFIVGLPETAEKIQETIRFAKGLKCYQYSISTLMLYPGTELFERAKEYGMVYDGDYHIMKHNLLTRQEIEDLAAESLKSLPTLNAALDGANIRNLFSQLVQGKPLETKAEAFL